MVAAAFIGPGTVTTAIAAGVTTGAGLLWAVLLSIVATVVLQELALRSALVTQRDLAALMRDLGQGHWWGAIVVTLIIIALGVGNAAYQSGNLLGAGLGVNAALSVATGAQESFAMSADVGSAAIVLVSLFAAALILRKRWQDNAAALTAARLESFVSILLGGVITTAIVLIATVAAANADANTPLERVMLGLEQRFPSYGVAMLGLGLFAAGFTSALAAPVAAGWAVCGALGWSTERTSWGFRSVALSVLATGTAFALVATRPDALIIGAQATNGLLLPLVAWVLLAVANSRRLLGGHRNDWVLNSVGIPVVCLVTALALRKLLMLL